jgi:hypothetical protein
MEEYSDILRLAIVKVVGVVYVWVDWCGVYIVGVSVVVCCCGVGIHTTLRPYK